MTADKAVILNETEVSLAEVLNSSKHMPNISPAPVLCSPAGASLNRVVANSRLELTASKNMTDISVEVSSRDKNWEFSGMSVSAFSYKRCDFFDELLKQNCSYMRELFLTKPNSIISSLIQILEENGERSMQALKILIKFAKQEVIRDAIRHKLVIEPFFMKRNEDRFMILFTNFISDLGLLKDELLSMLVS